MVTALVLGARGFLGRHVAEAMLAADFDLVEVGHGGAGRRQDRMMIDLVGDPIEFIAELIDRTRPGSIVNAVGATTGSAASLAIANLVATARLLEAIERVEVRPRLVQLGSAAEYGPSAGHDPVAESAPCRPTSAYGVSKLAATALVELAATRGTIDAVVLRLFNVVGPAMKAETLPGTVVAQLARAVESGFAAIETGSLSAVRDFVDVRDVAEAVIAACRTPGPLPSIVNIGSGVGRTSRDLVEELARQAGFTGVIRETGAGSPRSTGVDWQVADVTRAAAVLAWRATRSFEATCASILDHPDLIRPDDEPGRTHSA